mmetsp:Transcript_21110/g.31285  ORF Transcript_21110/g.31285 Transcript_21110/m.31285 type:complete len:211 (+) Transcript_21110:123-755(+)
MSGDNVMPECVTAAYRPGSTYPTIGNPSLGMGLLPTSLLYVKGALPIGFGAICRASSFAISSCLAAASSFEEISFLSAESPNLTAPPPTTIVPSFRCATYSEETMSTNVRFRIGPVVDDNGAEKYVLDGLCTRGTPPPPTSKDVFDPAATMTTSANNCFCSPLLVFCVFTPTTTWPLLLSRTSSTTRSSLLLTNETPWSLASCRNTITAS